MRATQPISGAGLASTEIGVRPRADKASATAEAAQIRQAKGDIAAERSRILADAEAQAAKTYADSFGKDPQFYDFYRAMQSYNATFANPENKTASTIVLSPDNDYLRQFRGK